MKKIIYFIGIICLIVVTILNILFTAILDNSEHIKITNNTILYTIMNLLLVAIIYVVTNIIDKKCKNTNFNKKKILIVTIGVYAVINLIWVIVVRPPIVGDQIHVCNLAQTFYRDDPNEFLPNSTYAGISLKEYTGAYQQQISLAFVFNVFFRMIHFDGFGIIRGLNVIANVGIIIALYMIVNHLSKKYDANKTRLLFLILTFIPLIMLATFIYGDIPSLALCLFATYFMMKYNETKSIKYPIYASILTSFAYMMRMNSLIFIIATIIYLVLSVFADISKKLWKSGIITTLVIIMYIGISIIPNSFVQKYYINKYDINEDAKYPTISFILIAMEESWRGEGWYSEKIGVYALKNSDKAKTEYIDKIKDRLEYFSENKSYAFEFYTNKITSMWSENTYSAIRNNIVEEGSLVEKSAPFVRFYDKAVLILICVCSCLFLIQNRKNISLDIILLLTIFIGGFAFHILWEAKSRYIIPYIIVLIPIASLFIKNWTLKK